MDADTLFYSFGKNLTSLAGNENTFFSKTKQVSSQNCYKHKKRLFLMQIWCSASWLDMLQVDLLARGASDEVARGRVSHMKSDEGLF